MSNATEITIKKHAAFWQNSTRLSVQIEILAFAPRRGNPELFALSGGFFANLKRGGDSYTVPVDQQNACLLLGLMAGSPASHGAGAGRETGVFANAGRPMFERYERQAQAADAAIAQFCSSLPIAALRKLRRSRRRLRDQRS